MAASGRTSVLNRFAPFVGAGAAALAAIAPTVPGLDLLLVVGLVVSVLAAVHHADVIAHRVGEPYGTLVLALSVTTIEVALIVSLMLASPETTTTLARDTIFATIMIILNGIMGACLLAGGKRHFEQLFNMDAVTAKLIIIATIIPLALILPNYALAIPGPYYSESQLTFVATVTFILFAAYMFVQTVRHREYFAVEQDGLVTLASSDEPPARPDGRTALLSLALLILSLVVVVISAKMLAPDLEALLATVGAPKTVIGILIAGIVLLPEGISAIRAALANQLQSSLNLALGSAIASIGLTIPMVSLVALMAEWPLALGLDAKSTVLLSMTLLVTLISLRTGKTTLLQGIVHLVLFATYLFLSFVP